MMQPVYWGFLDSGLGWLENNIEASLNLAYCLDEMDQKIPHFEALFASFLYLAHGQRCAAKLAGYFYPRQQYARALFSGMSRHFAAGRKITMVF